MRSLSFIFLQKQQDSNKLIAHELTPSAVHTIDVVLGVPEPVLISIAEKAIPNEQSARLGMSLKRGIASHSVEPAKPISSLEQ